MSNFCSVMLFLFFNQPFHHDSLVDIVEYISVYRITTFLEIYLFRQDPAGGHHSHL